MKGRENMNANQFVEKMVESYKGIDDLNYMNHLIHEDEDRFKNDPLYLQGFGSDYILLEVSAEDHSIIIQHTTSEAVFSFPTTSQYLEILRDVFFAYCYERKLFR